MFSQAWRGWRIVGKEIISLDGWPISRNDALVVPRLHAQLSAYRSEIPHLKSNPYLERPRTRSLVTLNRSGV
jgi:hypothetical protein